MMPQRVQRKRSKGWAVPLLGDPGIKTAMQRWYEQQRVYPAEGRRQLSEATGVPVRTLERAEQTGAFPNQHPNPVFP